MAPRDGYVWRGRHLPSAMGVLVPRVTTAASSPKRTLLIGWELGGGRGHVERLVPVVRAYLKLGWRVVAALRDAPLGNACFAGMRDLYGPDRLQVIQAPRFVEPRFPDEPLVSLVQIFCFMDFDDPAMVAPRVRHWEAIVRALRPDVVLSDYALTLNLAVRGRVPLQVIGKGWTLPPDQDVTPLLREAPTTDAPSDHEDRIVRSARAIVGTDRALRRSPEMPVPQHIAPTRRAGGLVYLPADHPARPSVAEACSNSNIAFGAYFGGDGVGQFGNPTVSADPIDSFREVPRSKVVQHGGLGTAMWAMVNGVAPWGCANDFEKRIYGNISPKLEPARAALVDVRS